MKPNSFTSLSFIPPTGPGNTHGVSLKVSGFDPRECEEIMQKRPLIYPNVAQFLVEVASDPTKVFRALEVVGFTPPLELRKTAVYTKQYKGRMGNHEALPANLVFLQKTVLFPFGTTGKVGGFLLADGGELPNMFVHGLTELITTSQLAFPKDGHLRWRTSAPRTNKLNGYLIGDKTLKIDPEQLLLDDDVIDMQAIQANGNYALHILTKKGTVFGGIITPEDIRNNRIAINKIRDGVNCILTVPDRFNTKIFYGTNQGIIINDDLLMHTERMKVVDLVVDSENPRLFFRTDEGKIFAIPVNDQYLVKGHPVAIDDVIKPTEQIFSGPAVLNNTGPALLAIDWGKDEHGFIYHKREITIPTHLAA